jgi:hypothetical protein
LRSDQDRGIRTGSDPAEPGISRQTQRRFTAYVHDHVVKDAEADERERVEQKQLLQLADGHVVKASWCVLCCFTGITCWLKLLLFVLWSLLFKGVSEVGAFFGP